MRNSATTREYLSIGQVAESIGVDERSVRRWISAGIIPAFRIGSRVIRVPADGLEAAVTRIPAAGAA